MVSTTDRHKKHPLIPPKRGHNAEFALTTSEIDSVIHVSTSKKSKAILILCSQGYTVKEVELFKSGDLMIDKRLQGLKQEYWDILCGYDLGFQISNVAIWRRVKKSLLRAAELRVVRFDPEKVPFPEALRFRRPETSFRAELISMAQRVHSLNSGVKISKLSWDIRDPLVDCPHMDCKAMRDLIATYDASASQKTVP